MIKRIEWWFRTTAIYRWIFRKRKLKVRYTVESIDELRKLHGMKND